MSAGPSFCHHCTRDLVPAKGGGFIFSTLLNPDGHQVRVHKVCVKDAVGDGYRALPDSKPRRKR